MSVSSKLALRETQPPTLALVRDAKSGSLEPASLADGASQQLQFVVISEHLRFVEGSVAPQFEPMSGVALEHMILYQTAGSLRIEARHDGDQSSKKFRLYPRGMQFVPAGTSGWTRWLSRSQGAIIALPDAVVAAVDRDMRRVQSRVTLAPCRPLVSPALGSLVSAVREEVRAGLPGGALFLSTIARAIAVQLLLTAGRQAQAIQTTGRDRGDCALVESAVDVMHAELASDLSLDDLSAMTGVSAPRLLRAFRAVLGTPPHRYLLNLRLNRARELLLHSSMTVTTIACECGFNSHAYFATAFRREFGVTPSALRATASGCPEI